MATLLKAAPDVPRRVAYDVLRAVRERDAYANLLLPALLTEARLREGINDRDAAFATELAAGTLRGRGTYDLVLEACLSRPLDKLDPGVRDVLRLGAHQLLATRVPPHAAVGSTVNLAREVLGRTGRATAGLVNAVLRKVSRHSWSEWVALVAPTREDDLRGHLVVAYSHPRWIVDAFAEALGDDAELEALLQADNVPAPVSLVALPGRAEVAELVAAGAAPGVWSPYAATLPGGNPAWIPAVAQRRARVQDEGSQLVSAAFAAVPMTGKDGRWLDLCAGPGGKAALLANLLAVRSPDALFVANERQPHRAELVAGALSGTPRAAVVTGDGTRPPWRPASFDRVLVDAPCSGLGALRRRPEARWRRTPADLVALGVLQRSLLTSALDSVRRGGLVGYVTCSPHPAETRAVVDEVGAATGAERVDVRPYLLAGEWGEGPDVQLWPHRHGTDAMYLAVLRRSR